MGRPQKKIDIQQLEQLAERQWTTDQIAAFFRVSRDTVERRYAEQIKESRHRGTSKIKDLLWERMGTSEKILVHCAKYYLGHADKAEDLGLADEPRDIIYKTTWGHVGED